MSKPKPKAAAPAPTPSEQERKALRKQAQLAVRLSRPEGSSRLAAIDKKNAARASALVDLLIQVVEVRGRCASPAECEYVYEVTRRDAVEYLEKSGLEKSIWQNIGS